MLAMRKRLATALTFALVMSTVVIVGAGPALADPVQYNNTPIASQGVNGVIWAVEVVGNTVFVGGEFTTAGGQPRVNLAAFSLTTGDVTSFRADATGTNATVRSLESNGTNLWVGGRFTDIDGTARTNLAELAVSTGAVDGQFTPNPNNIVNSLHLDGTNLFAGGLFTTIGEPPSNNRNQVAKITTTTGDPILGFRANADPAGDAGNVWDLAINGTTLYAVGSFTEFQAVAGGPVTNRQFVAALNKDTGAVLAPNFGTIAAEDVFGVEYSSGELFVGTRGQQALADDNKLIKFNATTGARLDDFQTNGDIQGLELVPGTVLIGSHDGYETQNDKLLALDSATFTLETFRPEVLPTASDVDGVVDIQATSSALVVAGEFDTVAGVTTNSLAIFPALSGTDDNTPPSAPSNLRATSVSQTSISLAWNPATDNVDVSSYEIYRNGARVGTSSGTTFSESGLTPDTTYTYTVRAVDSSGNVGAYATLNVKTLAPGEPPPPPPGDDRFIDDDDSVFEADIEWLAAEGVTFGCNPPVNDRFCPDDPVTRGQMAAFLVRFLGLTDDGGGNNFTDDDGNVFELDIAKLAAADITRGCNPPANTNYCPDDAVTRGQMAAFLVRALDLTDDGGGNSFVDDNGSIFELDIAKLAEAGITLGCNPPTNDRFCPDDSVTRGQMAAFLHRADSFR